MLFIIVGLHALFIVFLLIVGIGKKIALEVEGERKGHWNWEMLLYKVLDEYARRFRTSRITCVEPHYIRCSLCFCLYS